MLLFLRKQKREMLFIGSKLLKRESVLTLLSRTTGLQISLNPKRKRRSEVTLGRIPIPKVIQNPLFPSQSLKLFLLLLLLLLLLKSPPNLILL